MSIENIFTSFLIVATPFAFVYCYHLALTNSERTYAVAQWVGDHVCLIKMGTALFIITSVLEYIGWSVAATFMFFISCNMGILWVILLNKSNYQYQ